jgi:predicted methyltransferase
MLKLLIFIALTFFSALSFGDNIYQNALESSTRPIEDKAADTTRKPEKVLEFFDIQPNHKILDLFSGAGYYTELTAHLVGTKGKVDAHNNNAYIQYIGEEKLLKRYKDQRLPNVNLIHQEANDLSLCNKCYDRVLMVLTFHDLFYVDVKNGWNKIDAPALMEKIRHSLKPNGIVGIVDHVAPSDSGEQAGQTLHRIDPQLIKEKMDSWGFILGKEATFLHNPEDKGDLPMWDPTVKSKTNRAVMTFSLK